VRGRCRARALDLTLNAIDSTMMPLEKALTAISVVVLLVAVASFSLPGLGHDPAHRAHAAMMGALFFVMEPISLLAGVLSVRRKWRLGWVNFAFMLAWPTLLHL
jgi:hypothetical protein